jgi:hypothetical protein
MRFGCLALLLSAAVQAAPGLRLAGGPFLPYRVNHAVANHTDGILGQVELLGRRWDGAWVPLFRTRVVALSQVVELAFYLDEDIRGLELRVEGQRAEGITSVDLASGDGQSGPNDAEEAALRSRMRGLDPPIRLEPAGDAPERFSLVGSDLVLAGLQASSALFVISASRTPLILLGGFVIAALIATMVDRRIAKVLIVGMALGAAMAVVYLAAPRPTFISVSFPAAGPEARVSGVVERRVEELPDYRRVTYAGQGEGTALERAGTVDLVGLWAPVGRGVPLVDIVPPGSRVRFSSPPVATWVDGELRFESKDFITGWVVHELH